jgi:TPR repeat protein
MKGTFKSILLMMCLMSVVACAPKKNPSQVKSLDGGIASFKQQDYKTALGTLYPLAVQGNAQAQYAVGYMLYYGKAGAANISEGMNWIRKSAAQGNPLAERALGIFYTQANITPEKRT